MNRRAGLYGLALQTDVTAGCSVRAPDDWIPWEFRWTSGNSSTAPQRWDRDRVVLHLESGVAVDISRDDNVTLVTSPHRPSSHAWAHPLIGSTAVVQGAWQGWPALHAGAVLLGGRAWGILGDREMGKSTTLAWFASRGFDILADDLVIIRDERVFAGPRCLDLRETASVHFGLGEDIGVVGGRRRWRIALDPVGVDAPLAGWVVLDWTTGAVRVDRLDVGSALAALMRQRAIGLPSIAEPLDVSLIVKPVYAFGRPRDWARLDDAMTRLVGVLEGDAA